MNRMHRDNGGPLDRLFLTLVFVLACTTAMASKVSEVPSPSAGHKSVPNSRTQAALGKRLFFDARLSADDKISCASCHQPEKAFSDGLRVSQGAEGRLGTRNAPSLINVVFTSSLFWDGRRDTLEAQALDPFINPNEHGLESVDALLEKVRADEAYRDAFVSAFDHDKQAVSAERIRMAIAAYLRTLVAGDSPADRYLYGGEKNALTPAAVRGLELFRGRAACSECHVIGARDAMLSDGKFHSLGVGMEDIRAHLVELTTRVMRRKAPLDHIVLQDFELAELGRFLVTRDPRDIGKFRTPSLRNVALTAPYMHNGQVETLEEAVEREIYYRGLTTNQPLIVTPKEKEDLVAFLRSLTSTTLPLSPRE